MFNLHGKTVGIVGVGRVGAVVARILHGFGCRLLGVDTQPNDNVRLRCNLEYVTLPEVVRAGRHCDGAHAPDAANAALN